MLPLPRTGVGATGAEQARRKGLASIVKDLEQRSRESNERRRRNVGSTGKWQLYEVSLSPLRLQSRPFPCCVPFASIFAFSWRSAPGLSPSSSVSSCVLARPARPSLSTPSCSSSAALGSQSTAEVVTPSGDVIWSYANGLGNDEAPVRRRVSMRVTKALKENEKLSLSAIYIVTLVFILLLNCYLITAVTLGVRPYEVARRCHHLQLPVLLEPEGPATLVSHRCQASRADSHRLLVDAAKSLEI